MRCSAATRAAPSRLRHARRGEPPTADRSGPGPVVSRRLPIVLGLALVAATVAAYAPVFGNGFVNYDDDLYITSNPQVLAGLTRESVHWAFSTFHGANWFPLTWLSWMLDVELFGLSPRAFHATSLLLHTANTLLLFTVLVRMTGALAGSAVVAGIFALHPLHVESVAWAAVRKDVLSGFFWMLALVFYERFARRRSGASYAGVALCLALGMLAKPVVVTLPLVLLLLDFWPLGRLGAAGAWDRVALRHHFAVT